MYQIHEKQYYCEEHIYYGNPPTYNNSYVTYEDPQNVRQSRQSIYTTPSIHTYYSSVQDLDKPRPPPPAYDSMYGVGGRGYGRGHLTQIPIDKQYDPYKKRDAYDRYADNFYDFVQQNGKGVQEIIDRYSVKDNYATLIARDDHKRQSERDNYEGISFHKDFDSARWKYDEVPSNRESLYEIPLYEQPTGMVRTSQQQQQAFFNFDQVKSKTVLDLITKLIDEVTNITETYPLEKGETAEGLVQRVEQAIARFLQMGEEAIASCPIANDGARQKLREALADVNESGQSMVHYAREFIRDSTSSQRRAAAIQAGRKLLHDVAKFLIAADSVDVAILIEGLDRVKHELHRLKKAESKLEVEEICQVLTTQIEEVDVTIRKRISELIDNQQRDDLLAARRTLRSSMPLVYATTKAFVRHPENDESRQNREYAHMQMLDSLNAMQEILRGEQPRNAYSSFGQVGQLAADFEKFQTTIEMDPKVYRKQKHRPELEGLLEQIVSGSANIADAESTRASRKQRIVAECNNVRQALQDLLEEYERNMGRHDPDNQDVALGIAEVHRKSKDLKRHLRRAIVDHISDAFLDTRTPLLMLIEAAKSRDPIDTRNKGRTFLEHAKKLIDVAHLACEMSTDVDGIRIIKHTAEQLEQLAPEVVHAAMLLCLRPESSDAQKNMEEFKKLWIDKVNLLTMAIDSMTTLDDFLAVSEAHIIEDCKEGMSAIKAKSQIPEENQESGVKLDCSSGAIRGRAMRVCDVVEAEMDYMAPSPYTERVKQAVKRLRDQKIDEFANRAEQLVDRHAKREMEWDDTEREKEIDEFIEACSLVHDAVKDIRNALLVNRNMDDVDSDNEYEDEQMAGQEEMQRSDIDQQRIMRRLPEEDKKKIQQQIEIFKLTQTKFEREVAKWDETGNDLIVLAKHMCMIMMNMTDFTRGRGPLKTTMDVIKAAQEISEAGARLNSLARQIGEESVDSATKDDLFAYLQQIILFCQQLNICSKVKADVTQVGSELVVSGLDSAMSLIQTARNLLGAVVLTVKAAYIASTKFRRNSAAKASVEWRMAPPRKQPLVRPQKVQGVIRRASERRPMPPAKALAEFQMH